MSVWYEAEGTIQLSKRANFSIQKYLTEDVGIECKPSIKLIKESFDYYYFDVFWTNSLCGKDAAEEIHLVVTKLKEIDKNCLVDLECKVRFLT